MTYVVTENCIKCKYMDCVEVCPVDCFHEGENMVVINPQICIDCGVCELECPINAIVPETASGVEMWVEHNQKYAEIWPSINQASISPGDADDWANKPDKLKLFSPNPGKSKK